MKTTNKILSIILVLIVIMSSMIIPASAEAIPYAYLTIKPNATEVKVGDYVTVDVVLSENSDIGAIAVDLNYDPSVFEPVSMCSYGMFGDIDHFEATNYAYTDGKARFTGTAFGSVNEEGTLFTVVFLAIGEALNSGLSLSVVEAVDGGNNVMHIYTNTAYIFIDEYTNPTLTLIADKTDLEIGEYVGVDVVVSENSDIGSLVVDLVFDSSVFEPDTMFAYGMFNIDEDDDNEEINISYADGKTRFVGATPYSLTEEGVLFTVVFKVVGDASESEIWLSVEEACDSDYNIIHPETNTLYFDIPLAVAPTEIYINEPSRTTIRCKDGIVLHYTIVGEFPDDCHLTWIHENNNFDINVNDDGTLTIVSSDNGYTTFELLLVDSDGNVLSSDIIEMRSKAGFFDKIGGFFRSLFGATTIYEY